jgi:dipeptidyl aminopeptidase/acylaminoacyl peptidase
MRKISAVVAMFILPFLSIIAQTKRPISPADVYRYQQIGDPQPSPDGKWVAYVLASIDTAKDRRSTNIWMTSWDGKEHVQLTSAPESESSPRFSPDGKYLSFISKRSDDEKQSQLYLLDRRGGEARRLSNVKGEIEDYEWSADGQRIVIAMKQPDESDTAKSKVRKPYVIDRYHFKQDYQGYLDNRTTHLYLFTVSTKKLDTLTTGLFNENHPSFSPDGKLIAFSSNRSSEPDKNDNTEIYVMESKAGESMQQLTHWPGSDDNPVWSPDGQYVAYQQSTSDQAFTMYGEPTIAIISKNGGTPMYPGKSMDRPLRNVRWSKDGKSLAALMEDDRECQVVTTQPASASVQKITSGQKSYSSLEMVNASSWVGIMSTPQMPPELYAIENGKERRLTFIQDSFLAPIQLAVVSPFSSKSKDGATISGIMYMPSDSVSTKKMPLILYIHGGPVGQDEFEFDMTRQIYAQAGFLVAGVNYRGSSGRGVEFTKSIYGDWGQKEVMDIVGAADYLVQKGLADENRMGIAGWSYGGISTNYTIATDQRFKAAVSGAGSSLQLSMYGVDQYITQYETELGAPWKNQEKWISLSYPFFHADRIKTPTLFMASQNDFNVPSVGAEQMYQALRSLGVPTGLVIYPNQNHGISVPSYIKDRHERHIAWFKKYLK